MWEAGTSRTFCRCTGPVLITEDCSVPKAQSKGRRASLCQGDKVSQTIALVPSRLCFPTLPHNSSGSWVSVS